MLYELFTRDSPYDESMSGQEIRDAVCSGVRPKIPASCPGRLRDLMQGIILEECVLAFIYLITDAACWNDEPNSRPTFQQIVDELYAILIPDQGAREVWASVFTFEVCSTWNPSVTFLN